MDKIFELPIAKIKFFAEILVCAKILADFISNIIYLTQDYASVWTGLKNLVLDPCESLMFGIVIIAILNYIAGKQGATAAKAPVDDGTWFCPSCGTKNAPGKFCAKCGTKHE